MENELEKNCNDVPFHEIRLSAKERCASGRTCGKLNPRTLISGSKEEECPRGETEDRSQIGIYFIEDVKPHHLINIVCRELSTLTTLFPSVRSVAHQMITEFHHFKDCSGCLKNVSPLLPDVLKELQELIKFIRKKRNESYSWPDDSDYLRRSIQILSETWNKQENRTDEEQGEENKRRRKIREKWRNKRGEGAPRFFAPSDRHKGSRHFSRKLYRIGGKLSKPFPFPYDRRKHFFNKRKHFQSNLMFLEMPGEVDKLPVNCGKYLLLTEFAIAQAILILHPMTHLEKTIQLEITPTLEITHSTTDAILHIDALHEGESENGFGIRAKHFLTVATIALGKAFAALQNNTKIQQQTQLQFEANVTNLINFILQGGEANLDLSSIHVGKDSSDNSAIIINHLQQQKRGMECEPENYIPTEPALIKESTTVEHLQHLVEELKRRCSTKNQMIITLLNGLSSNFPEERRNQLITYVLSEADIENFDKLFRNYQHDPPFFPINSQTGTAHDFLPQANEKELKGICGGVKNPKLYKAKISFSEVISRTWKRLHISGEAISEFGRRTTERGPAPPPATTGIGNSDSAGRNIRLTNRQFRPIRCGGNEIISEEKGGRTDVAINGPEASAAINIRIKIGTDKTGTSDYHSAVSFASSGANLCKKKSEISLLPARTTNARFLAVNSVASKSFTNTVLSFKLPVTLRQGVIQSHIKSSKPEGIFSCVRSESCIPSQSSTTNSVPMKGDEAKPFKLPNAGKDETKQKETPSELDSFHGQINIYYEQDKTMVKLRSRLKFLEESLQTLSETIDRTALLTDKLSNDAYESCDKLKDICRRYNTMSNVLPS